MKKDQPIEQTEGGFRDYQCEKPVEAVVPVVAEETAKEPKDAE
jgi:hypothetical protein